MGLVAKSQVWSGLRAASAHPAGDVLKIPMVVRITQRFRRLHDQMRQETAMALVELGRLLEEGRERVRGRYCAWLRELDVSSESAMNYRRVYHMARFAPSLFADLKCLAHRKLYRLARLSARGRRLLLARHGAKALGRMNHGRFYAMTRHHLQEPRKITVPMRAHGLRLKALAVRKSLECANLGRVPQGKLRLALQSELQALSRVALRLAGRI